MSLHSLAKHLKRSGLNQHFYKCLRRYSSIDARFEEAKLSLNALKNDPGNETKLRMYALFKQATIGPNTTPKPGAFNFVGQAKWTAWNDLGEMSQDEAKQAYVEAVHELQKAEGTAVDKERTEDRKETESDARVFGSEGLIITTENQVTKITFNRPERKNAILTGMYEQITATLNDIANDDATSVVVLTGTGEYYSSGNDLKNFDGISPSTLRQKAVDGAEMLKRYVASFIDFPKPLISAVNGPALGIPVTQLALCDAVFASDTASFQTPFSKIGQSPEACSSYLFPKILGHSNATMMLLFNKVLTVEEAQHHGLVSKIFPHSAFHEDVAKEVNEMTKLPIKSLIYSKQLMRDSERDLLHRVNEVECERLVERWTSEDCINAIMSFLSKN